jgi:hypothetical protein
VFEPRLQAMPTTHFSSGHLFPANNANCIAFNVLFHRNGHPGQQPFTLLDPLPKTHFPDYQSRRCQNSNQKAYSINPFMIPEKANRPDDPLPKGTAIDTNVILFTTE